MVIQRSLQRASVFNETLRIASVPILPWTEFVRDGSGLKFGRGITSEFISALATYCGFSYIISTPKDKQWGKKVNDTWTGMIGMLTRNEVDLALGPFAVSMDRFKVGDFAGLYITDYLTILAAQSGEKQVDGFRSLYLLDRWTWILSFISFFVSAFFTTLVDRTRFKEPKFKRSQRIRKPTSSFLKAYRKYLWYYLGLVFSETDYKKIKKNATRIVVGVWCCYIFIITNGLQGSLIASLTLRTEKRPFETIKDIIEHPTIIPYIHQATAYEAYLKNNKIPEFQKLWKIIEQKNGALRQDKLFSLDTLQQIMRGEAVMVSDYRTMKYYVSKYCKDLGSNNSFYFGTQSFYPHGFTMLLNRNMPAAALKIIKRKTRNLFEAGLPQKWSSGTDRNWHLCAAQKPSQENRPLLLEDLQGIFYFLLIGIGSGVLYFGIEQVLSIFFGI